VLLEFYSFWNSLCINWFRASTSVDARGKSYCYYSSLTGEHRVLIGIMTWNWLTSLWEMYDFLN